VTCGNDPVTGQGEALTTARDEQYGSCMNKRPCDDGWRVLMTGCTGDDYITRQAEDELGRMALALDNASADDFPEAQDSYRQQLGYVLGLRSAATAAPVKASTGIYTRSAP